jgi:hypothetical protein
MGNIMRSRQISSIRLITGSVVVFSPDKPQSEHQQGVKSGL